MNVGWFIYRRMYIFSLLLLLISFGMGLGSYYVYAYNGFDFNSVSIITKDILLTCVSVVIMLFSLLFGNCLCLQKVKRRFKKGKTTPTSIYSWITFWIFGIMLWAANGLGYTTRLLHQIRTFCANESYTYFSNRKTASVQYFNSDGAKKEEKFFRVDGALKKQVFYLSKLFEEACEQIASRFEIKIKGKKEYGVSKNSRDIFYT
jgi:hypothetical protein